MKIGFIGLGNMGGPMCRNIVKNSNFEVTVWDLRSEAIDNCVAVGAKRGLSLKASITDADIVLTSLPKPDDVESVVLGDDGISQSLPRNAIYVDLSTNSPATIRRIGSRLEAKGIAMLDAPVSGGVKGAEDATIAIMVGGSQQSFETCLPVFESFGKTIVRVGDLGTGSIAKLINNMIAFTNMAAVAEGLTLGVAAGIDAATLIDVVRNSSGDSFALRMVAKKALSGDWSANFSMDLANKDLRLALQLATEEEIPLSLASQTQNLIRMAVGLGFGADDATAIMRVFEITTGHTIQK